MNDSDNWSAAECCYCGGELAWSSGVVHRTPRVTRTVLGCISCGEEFIRRETERAKKKPGPAKNPMKGKGRWAVNRARIAANEQVMAAHNAELDAERAQEQLKLDQWRAEHPAEAADMDKRVQEALLKYS